MCTVTQGMFLLKGEHFALRKLHLQSYMPFMSLQCDLQLTEDA